MSRDRLYQADDDQWYFSIRGKQSLGPFTTYHEASQALSSHVDNCQHRVGAKFAWPRGLNPARLLRRSPTEPRHT
ncbi:MAG: DUF6316 family protein [Gammaproteobacteria bacterium]|nr:DUF6316 family protein [Gammaproteobacteria bacterium]